MRLCIDSDKIIYLFISSPELFIDIQNQNFSIIHSFPFAQNIKLGIKGTLVTTKNVWDFKGQENSRDSTSIARF
jgi:hypothetical protein